MKPNKEHLKKALSLVQTPRDFEFLFNNLKSPDWLQLLIEEGIYESTEEINEHQGVTNIPTWGPSKYLVTISSLRPKEVRDIIVGLSNTKNPKVISDFLDALINIPTVFSVSILDNLIAWLDTEYSLFFKNRLVTLAEKYFSDGYDNEALKLIDSLLNVSYQKYENGNEKRITPNVSRDWEYNKILGSVVPKITSNSTIRLLISLLSDKLELLIKHEKVKEYNNDNFSDNSYIWRIEIEKNDQSNDDLEDIFINWIRDAGNILIDKNPSEIDSLLKLLYSKKLPIFTRIAIYFVWKNASRQDLVSQILLNKKYSSSTELWHEYALLLRDIFPSLNSNIKEEILLSSKDLTKSNNDHRYYNFLYLIKDYLPNNWHDDFISLERKYGKVEHPEYLFYFYGVTQISPQSPISIDELKEKNVDRIIEYLSDWSPPANERYGEYTYGLSQVVEEVVSSRSLEFSNKHQQLIFKNCSLVRATIQGFNKALSEKNKFDWNNVLEYLSKVASLFNDKSSNSDIDKEMKWSGVKESACMLIQKGFSSEENPLDIKNRHLIWKIIELSLNDSDPTEKREESLNKDFHHVAINSTRGIALETAIRYGLWIMKALNISREDSNRQDYGELFSVLDKHLNIQNEKSKAVRSVYGVWLPWLFLLDKKWARHNLYTIFPKNESEKIFKIAAWDSYLNYSQTYDEVFREIEPIYLDAITHIQNKEADEESVSNRIIDHIIIFYLKGFIDLNSNIISTLYVNSNFKIRSHIINFVGRMLNEEVVQAAISLWEWRVNECNKINNWDELREFGWWMNATFISGDWLLDQAALVLDKTSTIMPSHTAIEALVDLCSEHSQKVLKVFTLIVDKKVSEHGFYLWRHSAESLIPLLLETQYREETIQLLHKLGAYGMDEFKKFTD